MEAALGPAPLTAGFPQYFPWCKKPEPWKGGYLRKTKLFQEGISVMWRQYRPWSGHTASSHIPCSGTEVILSCGERLSRGKWGKHTPPWDPCLKAGGLILGTKPDLVTIIMNMQQRLPRQLAHLARNNPLSPPYAHGFLSSVSRMAKLKRDGITCVTRHRPHQWQS